MVEEKNRMKKIIERIKNVIFLVIGVSIVLLLGAILLTRYKDNKQEADYAIPLEIDYATSLYRHKTKYIDDVINITDLVYKLPLSKYYQSIELLTEK